MRAVTERVQAYWGSFARTGNPNIQVSAVDSSDGGGGNEAYGRPRHTASEWPRFRSGAVEMSMWLDEEPKPIADPWHDVCDFWDGLCGDSGCFGSS